MNEDVFNMSVRKFLKEFGITAQRESENTDGRRSRKAPAKRSCRSRSHLTLGQTSLHLVVDGEIELE